MLKIEAKDGIKKHKIELFDAKLWLKYEVYSLQNKFRLRVNGKWWPEDEMKFFYKTEIRDIIWRSIPFKQY